MQFSAVEIFKAQSLGLGSYGAVYRARADRLPCAAKLLHPILFQNRDPGAQRIQQRFEQECQFLSGIRHPNIVQYLGTCIDHDSGLPALFMELMDESLTHFLENSPEPLPYHLEVNFSYDVALALDYLHSHGVVHRDLSSNNVLLIAGSRAKVTDFGMSKLLDTALHMTSQTHCPGTVAYMSPEALRTPPVYNRKLDCFSCGVLAIQIMTRQFPNPGPARQVVEDPRYATGAVEVRVVECERRREHIELITPNHPLLTTALRCLEYHERNRPSAQDLCDQLATLREDPQYTQSVHQAQERAKGGASATADLAAKDEQIAELQRSLAVCEAKNQGQLQEKEEALTMEKQQSQLQHQEKLRVIEEQERQLRELNNQLQTSKQVTAEFQQTLLQKERRIRDLEERISAKDKLQSMPCECLRSAHQERQPVIRTPDITAIEWKQNGPLPTNLGRYYGAATADGTMVYIRDDWHIYVYNSDEDSWANLPDCPNGASSLVVVKGLLTAVGGWRAGNTTNTLVSLTGEDSQKKWSEHFPPMPTKRRKPAVVNSGRSLVAAGGHSGIGELSSVEVMDTDMLQWFVAASLPHPLDDGTLTICGDSLYLLGGYDQNGSTKSVLTCSLTALIQSRPPHSLRQRLKKALTSTMWCKVTDLPVYRSTCTTLCGQLVAIGGYDSGRYCDAVYKYDPTNNTWSIISHVPRPFDYALAASLPGNKVLVCRNSYCYTGSVECVSIFL